MSGQVHKTPAAVRDILEIYVYIGERNNDAAERWLQATERMFADLADMPGQARLWESSKPELQGVRVCPIHGFTNYLIFYRPIADGIEILHVLHGARDLPAILEDDG